MDHDKNKNTIVTDGYTCIATITGEYFQQRKGKVTYYNEAITKEIDQTCNHWD
jgi:hypothetical protein